MGGWGTDSYIGKVLTVIILRKSKRRPSEGAMLGCYPKEGKREWRGWDLMLGMPSTGRTFLGICEKGNHESNLNSGCFVVTFPLAPTYPVDRERERRMGERAKKCRVTD